ncbi:hypothetical protein DL546_009213 [Coniochaeta pulveracea]|uniref:Uncharacterized protein n=1 Tax=Coniochaeta pulveracea TaxID=177199 RepID=A0A420YHZ6_9PEZI|nr:hypothetical protein DL546_009213 [Coniochaeta pulveracea]
MEDIVPYPDPAHLPVPLDATTVALPDSRSHSSVSSYGSFGSDLKPPSPVYTKLSLTDAYPFAFMNPNPAEPHQPPYGQPARRPTPEGVPSWPRYRILATPTGNVLVDNFNAGLNGYPLPFIAEREVDADDGERQSERRRWWPWGENGKKKKQRKASNRSARTGPSARNISTTRGVDDAVRGGRRAGWLHYRGKAAYEEMGGPQGLLQGDPGSPNGNVTTQPEPQPGMDPTGGDENHVNRGRRGSSNSDPAAQTHCIFCQCCQCCTCDLKCRDLLKGRQKLA